MTLAIVQKSDFAGYITALDRSDRENGTNLLEEYAKKCGTSASYLRTHLRHRYKIPRPELMQALADHSENRFSYEDIVRWFYNLEVA
ncbi:hypothetical protein [Acinetobacter haemolyticus]|uniref:hypothetical protein n=1 Tax=Acinetobacter haemolyticus TaxID=29430 RepID=UPI000E57B741|nr:hypothetical protein [Acinetobacter haemolyticus]QDJ91855.1 hypothetical protein AhaeAN54_007055 [Acinetobacter haemolyticus]